MDEAADLATVRPARWWYVLAALAAALGTGAIALGTARPLLDMFRGFETSHRVEVPGSSVIRLDEPGDYLIYHERASDAQDLPDGRLPECRLVSRPTGAEISLQASRASMTYTVGGRSGVAIWRFHTKSAGEYELTSRYPEDVEACGSTVLTIGKDSLRKALVGVFGFLPLGAGLWVVAMVICVVVLVRRSTHRAASGPREQAPGSWSTGSP